MKRLIQAILYFVILAPSIGIGMEFSPSRILEKNECHTVQIDVCMAVLAQGEIKSGDTEALKKIIEKIEKFAALKTQIGMIVFDSKGGNVQESLKMGRYIRSRQFATFVTHDSICASACIFAYSGGVFRVPVGPLIIHSFYSKEFEDTGNYTEADKKYNIMADEIEKYLKEMRINRTLLDKIISIPHFTNKTLTLEENENFGLFGMDPVYAQTRRKN